MKFPKFTSLQETRLQKLFSEERPIAVYGQLHVTDVQDILECSYSSAYTFLRTLAEKGLANKVGAGAFCLDPDLVEQRRPRYPLPAFDTKEVQEMVVAIYLSDATASEVKFSDHFDSNEASRLFEILLQGPIPFNSIREVWFLHACVTRYLEEIGVVRDTAAAWLILTYMQKRGYYTEKDTHPAMLQAASIFGQIAECRRLTKDIQVSSAQDKL